MDIVGAGSMLGAYTAFDGCRALMAGGYLTPRRGAYAGQLGPRAGAVKGASLEPRSSWSRPASWSTGFLLAGPGVGLCGRQALELVAAGDPQRA